MARSFNVLYRFLAKDSFSGTSKKIATNNKKLGRSFKRLDKEVKQSDKVLSKTAGSFSLNFKIIAASALTFLSINKAIATANAFEDALADLSAITGATGKDLGMLENQVFKLSKASITSQVDVAAALKLVASAKPELLKNLPALVKTTESVLLLKNTGIDLESAVKATIGGLNAFGESAAFANRNVNILAAGSKFGSSEVRDTAEALKLSGPGARAAGLSFLDLNVAIQTLAKSEIKGSQAGTALNAMFARLRLSGKNFKDVGLSGVFKEVKAQLESIKDPTERAAAEFELFGLEHAKSGLAMLDNIGAIDSLNKSMRGTDAATEQASIRMATFSKKMELTGIILDEKIIKTMQFANTGIGFLADSIQSFVSGLDTADLETFGLLLSGLGTAVAGVAELFKLAFTVIMAVIKPVFAILKGIGTAIGQVVGAIATLDFTKFDLGGAFDIGGKFLGLFGGEGEAASKKILGGPQVASTVTPLAQNLSDLSASLLTGVLSPGTPIGQDSTSTTDINVNMNAPEGVIESIQSITQGRAANVGVNMAGG